MDLIKRNPRQEWDPFAALSDLQSDMNSLFSRSLSRADGWGQVTPMIEIHEEPDRFELTADMPGMETKDFSIAVQGNTLTLKGERKQEKTSKSNGGYYSEVAYGTFSRSIELPHEVQADKIKASYKDGVLRASLPKSESAKPHVVDVKVE